MDGLSNNIHHLTNEMNGLSSDMTSLSSDMTEDEILDADLILRSFGISDDYTPDEYSSLEKTEDISAFLNDISTQKTGKRESDINRNLVLNIYLYALCSVINQTS